MSLLPDPVRLALGLLTVVPVPPPRTVDRRTAGWALTLAPLVGALLGLAVALVLWLMPSTLLGAAVAVAALALLTRGLHLDGLADTADGLGSGRPSTGALEIMRRSDVGPFGVATLVLTLLVQVSAIANLTPWTACAAVVGSRSVLPLLGLPPFPGARGDGLGSSVAGSVRWPQAVAALVPAVVLAALTSPYLLVGPVVGVLLALHARRRLGGVTGDVYGACVEVALAAALVGAAVSV